MSPCPNVPVSSGEALDAVGVRHPHLHLLVLFGSQARGLAMAGSLVYATARRFGATLVTGDADFDGLPDTVVVR